MRTKTKITFFRIVIFVFLGLFCGLTAVPAEAKKSVITDKLIDKYDNYQIYFYNAEQCEPGTTTPGTPIDLDPDGIPIPEGEKWNGSCTPMTTERINWISTQISDIQAAASENGIPWELVPAQVFKESGGGKHEPICGGVKSYNPLGLKAKAGMRSCGEFAVFNNYKEAYNYYMNSIYPIRALKNKYPNNPYAAVAFIQYGTSPVYASCDSERYPECVGHMGEPTPRYVQDVSSIICGLQKWAKSQGIAISPVTWENYTGGNSNPGGGSGGGSGEGGAIYCNKEGEKTDPTPEPNPNLSSLEDYVKAWVWPNFRGYGFTERMPAYAEYIDNIASYTGGSCSDGTKGVDCGAFVSNIIKASGWDTNYSTCNTSCQHNYLSNNWNEVDAGSLQLGDVGYIEGHVILYIGDIPGFSYTTVSASLCSGEHAHSPMATNNSLNRYTWYRKM
ncbi:glucosaminidase domain-containing protein [Candidatus Saccharibacteria bacterium]|nr:glucosaminidase domain-containing protein [Candidatus Saccharibacteria bacterium]